VSVSFYLDTSAIVDFVLPGVFSQRVDAFLAANSDGLTISDFAAAEFAAVIARRVRTGEIQTDDEARAALADFDAWSGRATLRIEAAPVDIGQADAYIRRLDLSLRAPDAIHLAIVRRLGASLVTFDRAMTTAARTLGLAIAEA
jgi:hypothetical protein